MFIASGWPFVLQQINVNEFNKIMNTTSEIIKIIESTMMPK